MRLFDKCQGRSRLTRDTHVPSGTSATYQVEIILGKSLVMIFLFDLGRPLPKLFWLRVFLVLRIFCFSSLPCMLRLFLFLLNLLDLFHESL